MSRFHEGDTVWFYQEAGFDCHRHKKQAGPCQSTSIELRGTVVYVGSRGEHYTYYVIEYDTPVDPVLVVRDDMTCHAEPGKDFLSSIR